MKFMPTKTPAGASGSSTSPGRRGLVVGAGVAGVAAVAAHALHRGIVEKAPEAVAAKGSAVSGEGYQVTPHVLRYYETTRA